MNHRKFVLIRKIYAPPCANSGLPGVYLNTRDHFCVTSPVLPCITTWPSPMPRIASLACLWLAKRAARPLRAMLPTLIPHRLCQSRVRLLPVAHCGRNRRTRFSASGTSFGACACLPAPLLRACARKNYIPLRGARLCPLPRPRPVPASARAPPVLEQQTAVGGPGSGVRRQRRGTLFPAVTIPRPRRQLEKILPAVCGGRAAFLPALAL